MRSGFTGDAMRLMRGLRRGIDRLSLYLPVVLMGVLALATVWLVRVTPPVAAPAAQRPPSQEADYVMKGFSVRTFGADGGLRSEVSGERARHFPDGDTLEVDAARIRSFDRHGRLSVASASRALANGDGSEVQLFGGAVVVREAHTDAQGVIHPRMEFRSEFLHAFTDTERVRSHLPVTMVRGGTTARSDSFEFDNLSRTAQFSGRVRATLNPRAGAPAP